MDIEQIFVQYAFLCTKGRWTSLPPYYRYLSEYDSGLTWVSKEFCNVYQDSKTGLIIEKNLGHIIEEFNDRLQKIPLA